MIKADKKRKYVNPPRVFKKNFTVEEQAMLSLLIVDKTPKGRKKYKAYLKELEEK